MRNIIKFVIAAGLIGGTFWVLTINPIVAIGAALITVPVSGNLLDSLKK